MRYLLLTAFFVSVIFTGCNPSTTGNTVPFLWEDNPDPSSTQIMVVSTLEGENLIKALKIHLKALGFTLESEDEDQLITNPSELEGNLVRLNVDIDNNVAVIYGEVGLMKEDISEINWEPIIRGNNKNYGMPEWEIMMVLANNIDNKSILFN